MDFSSDANANFEGLLAVNREICMMQMAEKTSPDAPPIVRWCLKSFCHESTQMLLSRHFCCIDCFGIIVPKKSAKMAGKLS